MSCSLRAIYVKLNFGTWFSDENYNLEILKNNKSINTILNMSFSGNRLWKGFFSSVYTLQKYWVKRGKLCKPLFSKGVCNDPQTVFASLLNNTQPRGKIAPRTFKLNLPLILAKKKKKKKKKNRTYHLPRGKG